MPRYTQKITRLMDWREFHQVAQHEPDPIRQSLLGVLYLSGCRVSEALALTPHDVSRFSDRLYIQFHHLKGTKQTDPQQLPYRDILDPLLSDRSPLFPFSYKTAYRTVKRVFPQLYPHYFRMNWVTITSRELGDAHVHSAIGITARAIDHYRGKVDIGKVADVWATLTS